MRRIIAIFFLLIFASATTEFGQFLKLPILVLHYDKHQNQGMSLLGFIDEHYWDNHEDADKKEDMQLPFKNIISGPSITVTVPASVLEIKRPLVQRRNLYQTLPVLFIPSGSGVDVFHPPRTV